jgi:hypothetical protein
MNLANQIRGWTRPGWRVAVLILVVAMIYWLAWLLATDRSRRVIREIRALNGMATATQSLGTGIPGMRFEFGPLDNVYFLGPQCDDGKLKILEDIPRLRLLTLTNTRVTDEGLASLARFPELNCLYVGNVDHTKIIGPAGSRLSTPPLAGGKGLEALKDLPKLQVVQLIGPGTSDDDLKGIEHLKQIVLLDLKDTRVTKEGVARLQKALPKCSIRVR